MGEPIAQEELLVADEQRFSGASLPARQHGEFHSPHREPVQLLSYRSEPDVNAKGYSYAPDPLPPPPISTGGSRVELDAEPSQLYQMSSEASSNYKKVEIYEDPDKLRYGFHHAKKSGGKGFSYFVLAVAIVALLLGAGGLGIGLYHILFESHSSCDCDALENQVSALEERLQALSQMVTELQTQASGSGFFRPPDDHTGLRLDALETKVDNISHVLATVTSTERNLTLSNSTQAPSFQTLSLYDNCTATLFHSCSISVPIITDSNDIAFRVCETGSYTLSQEEHYTVDVRCGIVNLNSQSNPVITTLNIDSELNMARCSCYMENFITSSGTPECGLFVTKCPSSYQISQ